MRKATIIAATAVVALLALAVALILYAMANIPPPPQSPTGFAFVSARAISYNEANMTAVVNITVTAERPTSVDGIVLQGYASPYAQNATLLNCTIAPPPPVNLAAGATQTFIAKCIGEPLMVAVYHDGWGGDAVVAYVGTKYEG